MRKGVILEVNDDAVILLTPEGEFMRARKLQQDYQIGEEISFFPLEGDKKRPIWQMILRQTKLRAAAMGAAVILLGAAATFPVYQSNQVYAYMSIDVNPSLELGLNQKLKVVTIEAYNEAGERILSMLKDWEKEDAAVVAEKILDQIESDGYLQKDKNIWIATANSEKQKEAVKLNLEETLEEIKEAGKTDDLEVTVFTGTAEERASAVKQGVTMGVYKQQTNPQHIKSKFAPPDEEKNFPAAKPDPVRKQTNNPAAKPDPARNQPNDLPAVKPDSAKNQPNDPPAVKTKPAANQPNRVESPDGKQEGRGNGKGPAGGAIHEKKQSPAKGNEHGNNGDKKNAPKEQKQGKQDQKARQKQEHSDQPGKPQSKQNLTPGNGKNQPASDNGKNSNGNKGNGQNKEKPSNGKGKE